MTHRLGMLIVLSLIYGCAATLPHAPPILTSPRPAVPALHARMAPPPLPEASIFVNTHPTVQAALNASLQTPEPWRFQGGVLVFTATPGARYLVPIAVNRLTELRFAKGEAVYTALSGLPKCEDLQTDDPDVSMTCLSIAEGSSGQGASQQGSVALRPGKAGLRTNLLVRTTSDAYDIEIVSHTTRFVPVVQWERPLPVIAAEPIPTQEVIGIGYSLTSRTGVNPPWMPLQTWDDTQHQYIRFPPMVGSHEMPVLYRVSPAGEEVLVNYRVYEHGALLVADGVFDAAVLRVGKDPTAQLVDLRRTELFQYVLCPGAAMCPHHSQMAQR